MVIYLEEHDFHICDASWQANINAKILGIFGPREWRLV